MEANVLPDQMKETIATVKVADRRRVNRLVEATTIRTQATSDEA
jgi:hypothetical protein